MRQGGHQGCEREERVGVRVWTQVWDFSPRWDRGRESSMGDGEFAFGLAKLDKPQARQGEAAGHCGQEGRGASWAKIQLLYG